VRAFLILGVLKDDLQCFQIAMYIRQNRVPHVTCMPNKLSRSNYAAMPLCRYAAMPQFQIHETHPLRYPSSIRYDG
jgi:hypothetical protein